MPITAFLASTSVHHPDVQRSIWDMLVNAHVPNMLIVMAILVFVAIKFNLAKAIQQGHDKRVAEIIDTEALAHGAAASLEALKEELSGLPDEDRQLKQEAQERLTWLEEQLERATQEEQKRLLQLRIRQIEQLEKQSESAVLTEFGDAVLLELRQKIQGKLNDEQHGQLIHSAIEQINTVPFRGS